MRARTSIARWTLAISTARYDAKATMRATERAVSATSTSSPASTTAARAISVLIADDQRLVRAGFRVILASEPDIVVVGEAADGAEATELARTLSPDVVLMDIRMP